MPGLTHDSRFADNKSRTANRTELEQIISEATRRRPLDDLVENLKGAGIAHGMLNDLPAVVAHPALRNIPVRLPDGQVADIPAPPARTPWRPAMLGPVPALGQHDKDLRAEFSGLSKQ